ncbi:Uncharacterised protein [Mycobacteroides abscessus]|nr:Uncharacterised protein [Mycobacteroides abscessus]
MMFCESSSRTAESMNACCRAMRVRSEPTSRPMPVPWRARRKPIAS